MDDKDKLRQAKKLISEKRYRDAERILITLPDNDTAQRWLPQVQARLKPSRNRVRKPLMAFLVAVVVIGVVLALIVIPQIRQGGEIGQTQAALFGYCLDILPSGDNRAERCSDWSRALAVREDAQRCRTVGLPEACFASLEPAP